MGNLGNLVNNPSSVPIKKQDETDPIPETSPINDPIDSVEDPLDNNTLQQTIKEFSELKKQAGKQLAYSLLKDLKAEVHNHNLLITLTGNTDRLEFDEIKTEFLSFVNQKMGRSFTIDITIEKSTHKTLIVYTNKDKLEFLSEQNPFLLEFCKEMGLDLE